MAHKTIPLHKVVANPFRHMDHYPVNEEKLRQLEESMGRTGFWDNVVARQRNGVYELAYGHHRWIAFGRKYGEDSEITLIVRDLSDEDMLRVMADENMQEFASNAIVDQETVRAVVLAYAEGKIKLERPKALESSSPKARTYGIRLAPSFLQTDLSFNDLKTQKDVKPYNAESIGRFLGWMSGDQVAPRIRDALVCLEKAEEAAEESEDPEIVKEFTEMCEGLTPQQAKEAVRGYEATKKDSIKAKVPKKQAVQEGIAAGKEFARDMREGGGLREVRRKVAKIRAKVLAKPEVLPMVESFCRQLSKDLYKLLSHTDDRWDHLNEIIKYREDIDADSRNEVVVSLRRVSERCLAMIDAINGERPKLLP